MLKSYSYIASFLLLYSVEAQNLKYDIIRGDSEIGSLVVTHTKAGLDETFTILNKVEIKVLFTFAVEYQLSEKFTNGILISGKGYNSMNGQIDKETSLETTANGYNLVMDGIAASPEKDAIKASVSQIYHHEPFDHKPIYSQYFGVYLYAEKVGEHQYSVVSPDGENIYTYENGYCKEVKVSRDFATFYIRISPETSAMLSKKK